VILLFEGNGHFYYCVMTIAVVVLIQHTQQQDNALYCQSCAYNVHSAYDVCLYYTLLQAFNTMLSTSQAQAEQVRAQLNGPPTASETANSETASSNGNGHNGHATAAAEETQYDDMKPLLATLQSQSQPHIEGLSPIQVSTTAIIHTSKRSISQCQLDHAL
jgi:hypothetical protein